MAPHFGINVSWRHFEWAIREAKDLFELDGLSNLKPTRATSQYQDGTNEGEIRDREKVTRNLKMDTWILKSMRTNHDYVRPAHGTRTTNASRSGSDSDLRQRKTDG
jgi:hypothetical protein